MRLSAQPASVRDARARVRSLVADWPPECTATLQVLVDELVTNAVLHARSETRVEMEIDGSRLRVAVHDASPVVPRLRRYTPEAVTGRGLLLVDRIADRWGVEPDGDGKAVWFELTLAPLAGGRACRASAGQLRSARIGVEREQLGEPGRLQYASDVRRRAA